MTKIFPLTIVLLTVFLAGCNTLRGAGQDISATGHAISSTASQR